MHDFQRTSDRDTEGKTAGLTTLFGLVIKTERITRRRNLQRKIALGYSTQKKITEKNLGNTLHVLTATGLILRCRIIGEDSNIRCPWEQKRGYDG